MKKIVGMFLWFCLLGLTGFIIWGMFYKFNVGSSIVKEEELDINLELVKNLYEMANPSDDAGIIKPVYKEEKITNEYKIDMGIREYLRKNKENYDTFAKISYINEDDVDENIKRVLGRDVSYQNQDVKILGAGVCGYNYNQDGKRYEKIVGCGGNMFEKFYRKITKAQLIGNTINIYEKSIYVYDDWNDYESKIYIYNDCKMNKLLDYIEIDSTQAYEVSLDNYIDEAATYKYTFEKEDNHYILKKIEQVIN